MSQEKPDNTQKFPTAEGKLYLGAKLTRNGMNIEGDHMIIQHVTGHEDDVFVFRLDGKRHVGRKVLKMSIQSSSPAIPAATSIYPEVADVEPDEEKKLLDIYDNFAIRTVKEG